VKRKNEEQKLQRERERERNGMGKILGFGIFCVYLFVIVL